MKAATVWEMIKDSRGSFALHLAGGEILHIGAAEYITLPSRRAEELDPIAIVYTPTGIRLVDLTKIVSIEVPPRVKT